MTEFLGQEGTKISVPHSQSLFEVYRARFTDAEARASILTVFC
jgi:hypothetical protein